MHDRTGLENWNTAERNAVTAVVTLKTVVSNIGRLTFMSGCEVT